MPTWRPQRFNTLGTTWTTLSTSGHLIFIKCLRIEYPQSGRSGFNTLGTTWTTLFIRGLLIFIKRLLIVRPCGGRSGSTPSALFRSLHCTTRELNSYSHQHHRTCSLTYHLAPLQTPQSCTLPLHGQQQIDVCFQTCQNTILQTARHCC
jgi:hypothetical protein